MIFIFLNLSCIFGGTWEKTLNYEEVFKFPGAKLTRVDFIHKSDFGNDTIE